MDVGLKRLTVACLISPVAVWPAQKTRPGTLTAGPAAWINGQCQDQDPTAETCVKLTVVRLWWELLA